MVDREFRANDVRPYNIDGMSVADTPHPSACGCHLPPLGKANRCQPLANRRLIPRNSQVSANSPTSAESADFSSLPQWGKGDHEVVDEVFSARVTPPQIPIWQPHSVLKFVARFFFAGRSRRRFWQFACKSAVFSRRKISICSPLASWKD